MATGRPNLEISTQPKPKIQINRPLVITIGAIIATIFLFAMVAALTHKNSVKKPRNSNALEQNITVDKPIDISPDIRKLPENYSDVSEIKKFFPREQNDHRVEILLKQFEELQSEYHYLKELLNKREYSPPREIVDDEKTLNAKRADLVFNGLGSQIENIFSGNDRNKFLTKDEKLIATPAQEELVKNEIENKRRLDVAKGNDKTEAIYDMHNVIKPISKYQVQAGTMIPAILDTGIETSVVGTIVAHVKSNIYDTITGKYLLIPKGSKLIGEYDSRTTSGQRRILIEFGRIIRPDGSSILLGRALGADAIGQSGISGDVNNHWARILGAATISTILTVGAGIGSDSISRNNYYQNSTQRGIAGGSQAINNVGQSITNQALSIKPTITIPPGKEFNVMVRKDMILTPFNEPSKTKVIKKAYRSTIGR